VTMHLPVESSADHGGVPMPRSFCLHGRHIDVTSIIDQWPGPDYLYVKVKGDDGALYILRFEEMRGAWQLTLFASERAQALSVSLHDPRQRRQSAH
jgi:hypothetical protein